MTISFDPVVTAALTASDTLNNPIVSYDNAANDGTLSTGVGTEVESASLAGTGTTHDAWIATASPGGVATLELNLAAGQSLSFVAITAHNIGTIGATVAVQYSTDSGANWIAVGAGSVAPTDNRAIAWYFSAQTAADWRIRVSDAGSNNVEIAVALFSNPITIEQRIYQGYAPPTTPNFVDLQSNVSEGNNLLGSAVIRRGSRARASFTHITPAFLRSSVWLDFQRHFNSGGGSFWAWRPTSYDDVFYAWRDSDVIAPQNSGPAAFQSFEMGMRFYDQP